MISRVTEACGFSRLSWLQVELLVQQSGGSPYRVTQEMAAAMAALIAENPTSEPGSQTLAMGQGCWEVCLPCHESHSCAAIKLVDTVVHASKFTLSLGACILCLCMMRCDCVYAACRCSMHRTLQHCQAHWVHNSGQYGTFLTAIA